MSEAGENGWEVRWFYGPSDQIRIGPDSHLRNLYSTGWERKYAKTKEEAIEIAKSVSLEDGPFRAGEELWAHITRHNEKWILVDTDKEEREWAMK